jgi:plasmid stability protein
MRTTITLDEDVAAKLKMTARKSGRPFKDVVNDALRAGLAVENQARKLPPFKIEPGDLIRLDARRNYDKPEDVFDELDTPRRLR